MKKLLSITLILCLLLSLSTTLVSCGNRCKFSTEWSKDSTSHWHACTKEGCTEISDKADHTWDEGKTNVEATPDEDGEKTFTCTVCSQTKTEAYKFAGISKAEWNAAIADKLFENFSYKAYSIITKVTTKVPNANTTETVKTKEISEYTYKFTKDSASCQKITSDGTSNKMYDPAEVNYIRDMIISDIKSIANYNHYKYDAETKTYKATMPVRITSLNASTSDVSIEFKDNKLFKIKYSVSYMQGNTEYFTTSTIVVSKYGTTVVLPVAKNTTT